MKKIQKYLLLTASIILLSVICAKAQPPPPDVPYGNPVPVETGMLILGGVILAMKIKKHNKK